VLTERATDALKVDPASARAAVSGLAAAGLVTAGLVTAGLVTGDGLVTVTDAGRALFDRVRAAIGPIVARAYGDVSPGDLQTAARVLTTITAGLNRELACP
jgi:DNA-binding MarR family transcriptional regulator